MPGRLRGGFWKRMGRYGRPLEAHFGPLWGSLFGSFLGSDLGTRFLVDFLSIWVAISGSFFESFGAQETTSCQKVEHAKSMENH